ncbi:MAG: anti-sigma factor [Solirubrobacterales bacterium]|nr:anti-sigma factor [Solirubrobacterales bacterium]
MSTGHDRFREQLPAYLLGALDPGEQGDLEHHLEGCPECRAELAWLEPASTVLSADVEQIEPSPSLKSRVMAAVDADIADNPSPESGPAETSVPETSAAAGRDDRRPSRPSGWLAGLFRPAVLGTVAAALFIGVAIGVVLDGGSNSTTGPARQVITGQSTIGAEAVMVASNGTGTLKMSNLRRPGENQVYQAWIQCGQEIEPTDSLFVPNSDGSAVASIPDISGVSAVMVSAEPKGGSQQPTTAPVITVSVPG